MDDAGPALGDFNDVLNSFGNTNLQTHWLSRSLFPATVFPNCALVSLGEQRILVEQVFIY